MASNVERPITELLQDIGGNVQEIIRSELRLARAEVRREVGSAAKAAIALIVAMICGVYAIGFLILALVYGLATLLASWWIAALIVGAALAALALVMLSVGRGRMRTIHPAPERTIRTVKENLTWDKHRKT
jgi:Zn-dependent protease with chaperone function